MKTPIRRSQLALLFTLLTLVGVSISAQRIWEMTPPSLKAKMQSFQRAAAPPDASRQTGESNSPADANNNNRTAPETELVTDVAQDRFNLPASVIPGGGGNSTDGRLDTTGAIGQGIVGVSSDGTRFGMAGGFWAGGGVTQCPTITVNNPPDPSGVIGTALSRSFTQSGASGTVTFSLNSGTLPNGVTLNSNGTLTGTPQQFGNFAITVKVTDSNNCMGIGGTYTLVISCQSLSVFNPNVATGAVGTFFSQSFTQNGGIGTTTFSLNGGALPPGLTLAANGTLSGTPTQAGSFTISVRATDSNGCSGIGLPYALVITGPACGTITLSPVALPAGTVGTPYSQGFSAAGGNTAYTFSLTAGSLPGGLSLSPGGILSGTPTANGNFNFTVTATDVLNCSGSRSYTLTIGSSCPTLTIGPATSSLPNGTAGLNYAQTFTVSGGTPPYTFRGSGIPGGLQLDSQGVLFGSPTGPGTSNITVFVRDASGVACEVSRTYTLVIVCQTLTIDPPTLSPGTVGQAYSVRFTAGLQPPIRFTVEGNLPPGLQLDGNVLEGIPAQAGTFNFTVNSIDAVTCRGSRAYTLTIGSSCPIITLGPSFLPNGTPGQAYNQTLTATGGAAPYNFTALDNLPQGLTLSTAGVISGTPTRVGNEPFRVRVRDANNCEATRSYNLAVDCPAPYRINPPQLSAGTVGQAYSVTFTADGALPPLRFTTDSGLPPGLQLAESGVLAGTPTQAGTFNFTVRLQDVNGCPGSGSYTLVINPQANARLVRAVATSGAPSNPVSVPIELVSQGDENALSFSLTFDPAVLSNPQAVLGSDAGGASIIPNPNQVAAGRLGLIVTLPAGQSFSAGVRRILVVTFTILANASGDSTTVSFGDQPVPREISNVAANTLTATYTGATVSITRGIEADVTPRPTGNGDVTTTDLVLMGRFIALLDTPAPGGEFQRADSAPRSSLGNGVLGLADLVQTGRYVARLDDLVPAGGPTAPQNLVAGSGLPNARRSNERLTGRQTDRWVRLLGHQAEPGTLTLTLNASGDENALSFGLRFNPSQWRFVAATAAAAAANTILTLNTNEASQGRLGFVLALAPGQAFAPGAQDLVSLQFEPMAKVGKQTATPVVGFADALVACEIVAADASQLAARFTGTPSESEALGLTELSHLSAANGHAGELAREQVVAASGLDLAAVAAHAEAERSPTELAGTRVEITDSRGATHSVRLLFVSPEQVKYQIPANVAAGEATVTVIRAGQPVAQGVISITSDTQR